MNSQYLWTYIQQACVDTSYRMCVSLVGKKEFNFTTMAEFMAWKDKEEEATNTSYVRTQQNYHPVSELRYHLMHKYILICICVCYMIIYLYNQVMYNLCMTKYCVSPFVLCSILAKIKERLFYICCRSGNYQKNT